MWSTAETLLINFARFHNVYSNPHLSTASLLLPSWRRSRAAAAIRSLALRECWSRKVSSSRKLMSAYKQERQATGEQDSGMLNFVESRLIVAMQLHWKLFMNRFLLSLYPYE
jgi:hypothetical protein